MRVFVLDGNLAVGELGDAFERLEWTRRLWQPHSVTLDLNLRQLHAASIEKGRLLYLPDEGDLAFLIEHIETNDEPGAGKDAMRVIGRAIDAIATEERLAQPPAGQAYDKQTAVAAETAMKHYVDENAGPGAAAARAIPDFAIAADLARGTVLSVSARYQLVGDILREIGYGAGMGWETAFDPATGAFEFDVIPGVDRTASVFFDTAFDTLERYSELDTLIDTKTHAVVAGQGEGEDREIVERFLGAEKAGLDRREVFIDARDVEMGDTGVLEQRGDSALEALQAQKRYEATAHPYGSFRYREHWDLGDLVTLRDADRSLEASVRIVTVTSRISDSKAAPEREVQLDRPFPTLKDRVGGSNPVTGGAVDSPLSLPPDPHSASHEEGGLDPLDGILSLAGVKVAQRVRAAGGGFLGAEQARNTVEAWLSARSLIALGENADGDANPAVTLYRTSSGLEQGAATRLYMASAAHGLKVQKSTGTNTAYGAETFDDLVEFTRNQGEMILGGNPIRFHVLSLGIGATVLVADADMPRSGMALIWSVGNNGAGLIQYYRNGSFNNVTGTATQPAVWEFRNASFSAGAGQISVFIEGNSLGNRLGVKNNLGFATTIKLVTIG